MTGSFIKFPSTPHLAVLPGASVRGDKVLSDDERAEFITHGLIIEEKIDGANLGISFDSDGCLLAQNRGNFLQLPQSGQWQPLADWIAARHDLLFDTLGDRYVLFGEWCYARHSIYYRRLPDWFLGFDIFEHASRRFLSTDRRDVFLAQMQVHPVPVLARGQFLLPHLIDLLGKSSFGDEPAEGLYLREEDGDWLRRRAKLVRPSFIQTILEHWSRRPIRRNLLAIEHT